MTNDNGKRGFAGLDSMVSKVDPTPPAPVEQPQQPTQEKARAEDPRPVYIGNPRASSGASSSWKWWLIGIGILVFFVWIKDSAKPSNEERIPPVGTGLILDRSQIRYCLSQKIRLDVWQGQVNRYSDQSVNAFNAAVSDYNARCSDFRYRSGALEDVRSEVEENRAALIRQGLDAAALNP